MSASPGQGTAAPARRGGPPAWFIAIAVGSLALGAVIVLLGALGITVVGPRPQATMPPTTAAADRTWAQVASVLGTAQFQVQDPVIDYRPSETRELQSVPRRLLQAILPAEPQGGYVVIYDLPTNGEADRVGREFAAYLASGSGAIAYPRDTQFVLRRIGPTLVFYPWSAATSADPRVADLAAALETLGSPVSAP